MVSAHQGAQHGLKKCPHSVHKVRAPRVLPVHHMKERKSDDTQDFQAYRTEETGDVVWIEARMDFSVSICESYNVEAFPFDIQWLELKGAPADLHPDLHPDLFAAASHMKSRWSRWRRAGHPAPQLRSLTRSRSYRWTSHPTRKRGVEATLRQCLCMNWA